MSPQKFGVGTKITEVQRQSHAPGDIVKDERTMYWTRLVCVPNWLLQKSWTLLQDDQFVQDKQLTQYLLTLIGRIEVLAISFCKDFSKFRDAGREDCFCSEQDHPEFPIQAEGQSRGTESPEGGPVSTRKTDRLHDLRQLSSVWRSWPTVRLCWFFSVTLHDDNVQEFDTRWDEVLLFMWEIPSDDILDSLYKLRIRESAQLKTVLELYDMEIQLQEENESGGANGPNGRPIFQWKTHCVFDLQILSKNGAHEAVLECWDQFSITSHGDDIQNFDNCWDQVVLSTCEVPTDSILESLYKRRTRVSSTRAGALSCLVTRPRPLTSRMSPEVQGHRPARPHEIFTPETNELKQEYFLRLEKEGMSELKGNKEIANSGKQTDSVHATMIAHVDNKYNRLLLFQDRWSVVFRSYVCARLHPKLIAAIFGKNSSIWQESTTRNLSWLWADRGVNLERRYFDGRAGRFGKVGCSRNLSLTKQRERDVDQTERWWTLADGTAKLSGRDYEFRESTPRREPTVRSEDFSRELHGEPR